MDLIKTPTYAFHFYMMLNVYLCQSIQMLKTFNEIHSNIVHPSLSPRNQEILDHLATSTVRTNPKFEDGFFFFHFAHCSQLYQLLHTKTI